MPVCGLSRTLVNPQDRIVDPKVAGSSPVGHLGFADYYLVRVAEPYDPALVVTTRLPRTFPANV